MMERARVAITMGDPADVGAEIVVKALSCVDGIENVYR